MGPAPAPPRVPVLGHRSQERLPWPSFPDLTAQGSVSALACSPHPGGCQGGHKPAEPQGGSELGEVGSQPGGVFNTSWGWWHQGGHPRLPEATAQGSSPKDLLVRTSKSVTFSRHHRHAGSGRREWVCLALSDFLRATASCGGGGGERRGTSRARKNHEMLKQWLVGVCGTVSPFGIQGTEPKPMSRVGQIICRTQSKTKMRGTLVQKA